MHLFIVTSVIYTKHASVFSPETRLNQLINTIQSIRKHMNDKKITEYTITVLEGSPLSQQDISLLSKHANYICMFNITDLPKSIGESVMLKNYFEIDTFKTIQPTLETISKVSGRYYLTEEFNFNRYPLESSVIKTYDDVYDTRYYRFNASNADFFISKLDDVMKTLDREDIEHSFYRNQIFPKHTLIHPNTLGVEGQIAPSGAVQKD